MLGHGYTAKPDYPYEIPRYVEHLVDYLDACGIDRAHLAGESLGGWVAGWLATEQPERVRSLQLVAAGGTKANPEVMERIKSSTTQAVTTDDIALDAQAVRAPDVRPERMSATSSSRSATRSTTHPTSSRTSTTCCACRRWRSVGATSCTTERLGRITAPTLVVWGNENPFGEVPEATAMHEAIPGSRLELFPECGHWPQHEQAERYNPLSIEFLRSA